MNIKSFVLTAAFSSFCIFNSAFGQGALTPPGSPAPTMKSLDQIEARTPISSAPFTITKPGSYYLTTNVSVTTGNAITIATNGVKLDLNGFTISSTAASATGTGISLNSGLKNLTIVNGFIQGSVTNNGSGVYSGGGFAYGIYYPGSSPATVLVSAISVSGCLDSGIFLGEGNSSVVDSCAVQTVGSDGIVASIIKNCSALDCGSTGIAGDNVSDCRGQSTGGGDGVYANYIIQNSYGSSSSAVGVFGDTVQNCFGYSASSIGLDAVVTLNCYGQSSGNSYGIYSYTAENCYGYCGGNSFGIYANYVANGCFGYSSSGTGIYAFIANVCHGTSNSGVPLSTSHNVNSF